MHAYKLNIAILRNVKRVQRKTQPKTTKPEAEASLPETKDDTNSLNRNQTGTNKQTNNQEPTNLTLTRNPGLRHDTECQRSRGGGSVGGVGVSEVEVPV